MQCVMAILLENVTNSLWQAFVSLQQDKGGFVHKSKLKVLTANIGTILDLYGVEKGLEHYRSTQTLNFDQFKYYLQKELFSALPTTLSLSELRNYESSISEICWLVCRKHFIYCHNAILSEKSLYKIFRIFCVLAELIPDTQDENIYQVLLHPWEANYVAQSLARFLGCPFEDTDFTTLSIATNGFRLNPFIALLETKCFVNILDENAVEEAVTDIYQTFVEDVMKKGFLSKKGYIFPSMKEYWFVLKPYELSYYKTRSEKERSGSIPISPGNKIDAKSCNKIVLHASDRIYEFGTPDHVSRLQWAATLQLAVEHSADMQTYQRIQSVKRRLLRKERIQEMLKARNQLQQERMARQAAEVQAKELEALVKEDSKKLNDLEQLKEHLEKLLQEESQAKRDEEIVRNLQARVLAEEWEKREELEKLQEEQRRLLEEERRKRLEYEELQREKEEQLKSAEDRLAQLEKERQTLDEELRKAHDKIKKSEDKKTILENKLYEVIPRVKDGMQIRRTQSFIPSTKEKPLILPINYSNTLKKKM